MQVLTSRFLLAGAQKSPSFMISGQVTISAHPALQISLPPIRILVKNATVQQDIGRPRKPLGTHQFGVVRPHSREQVCHHSELTWQAVEQVVYKQKATGLTVPFQTQERTF